MQTAGHLASPAKPTGLTGKLTKVFTLQAEARLHG
jgi:hypothetical protein